MSRFVEFFEDDETERLSMNRLCTFIAVIGLFFSLIFTVVTGSPEVGALAGILAGLGGFNYAAGRAGSAYTTVRVKQAEAGIQPPAPAPAAPAVNFNMAPPASPPVNIPDAKNVTVDSQGDVNISKGSDDGIKRSDN
jgi:hypothetical protein